MDVHNRQPSGTVEPNDVQDRPLAIQIAAPEATSHHSSPVFDAQSHHRAQAGSVRDIRRNAGQ